MVLPELVGSGAGVLTPKPVPHYGAAMSGRPWAALADTPHPSSCGSPHVLSPLHWSLVMISSPLTGEEGSTALRLRKSLRRD